MRKVALCFGLILLIFSCKKDSSSYATGLKDNLEDYNNLLRFIEKNYKKEFLNYKNSNRIVFADCNLGGNNYKSIICDANDVLEKMSVLDITEITFEKYSENCNKNYGFNQVNFKLKKEALESTVYYRYEYCGTGKIYKSNTIIYEPVDSNWSVFVDLN